MEIFNDYTVSVKKALYEIDDNWHKYQGLVICGTHTPKLWEKQIEKIEEAREKGIPFLGICFGFQLAGIEYARNVMGIRDATSEEFKVSGTAVVKKLRTLKIGLHDGESYWHNYYVIPEVLEKMKVPENFFICQYHPEYQSSIDKPHPLLVKFLKYAKSQSKNSK